VRRLVLLVVALGLAMAAAGSAGTATSAPATWMIFETRLSWTRTATITSGDDVECVSEAKMTAQSARFYTARRPPRTRNRLLWFGLTRKAIHTGTARERNPIVAGTARLEVGPMRCGNGPVDTRCAKVYSARLIIGGLHGGDWC
jgi:hypothetical protein